jgi:hypothetical protein
LRIQQIIFAGVVLALLAISTVFIHDYFTEPYPGFNDFMSRWEGARSFVIDGLNPYGDEASLNIQEQIYGRPVVEGEDPGYFAYPFYTIFMIWPLVYMSYAWASAIWMVLLAVCVIVSLLLLLDLFSWKPKIWLRALLIYWSLIFYFAGRGLILGQVGLVVYLLEMLTVWALIRNKDELAGVALALSTVKPQMAFLFVPFLLIWGLRAGRWRFLGGFGVSFGVLMGLSFLMEPSWLGDWIAQVRLYPSYTVASPVWILTQMYLGLGDTGEQIVTLALYGLLLWTWYGVVIQKHYDRFLWVVSLTLVITHLVAPRTATPHFLVFMLPLVFYFAEVAKRNRRHGSKWVVLILAALLIIPWVHFLVTIVGDQEHPVVHLPLPFGLLLLLWFTRRMWWQRAPEPMPLQPKAEPVSSAGVHGASA